MWQFPYPASKFPHFAAKLLVPVKLATTTRGQTIKDEDIRVNFEETSLYYLKSRYYDPITGRFITIDDISYIDPETINGLWSKNDRKT